MAFVKAGEEEDDTREEATWGSTASVLGKVHASG